MRALIKSLSEKLNEVPEGIFPPEYYTPTLIRGYIFGSYSYPIGVFIHAFFIVIFALIGVTILALFNVLSVILWAAAFLVHRKGYFVLASLLIYFEVIAHATLCVIVIGWDTGFQYYVLLYPAIVFLTFYSTPRKIAIAAIFGCTYAAMNYYANISVPYIELNSLYIVAFNYGNIFSFCSTLALVSYAYYAVTINAEEKLEKEHQKTNAALIERNQALMRLNQELSEAADYVRTILPQPITEGSIRTDWRFVPSTSLGGDAFGYHMLDEDHFTIYLIDVSGHGVGAALLSVSVMNVLRSQSLPDTDFKDPEQVLGALNIAFPGEENNDMFFTIWYGVYSKSTRELTYASGGHPPALLLDDIFASDSKVTPLKTPNCVIGGMPEITYKKREYIVGKHNTLYIFSDGVYEIEKSDGSMWQFQEFTDFISEVKTDNQSTLDRLYAYARNLGNLENFEDDFTIIEVVFS